MGRRKPGAEGCADSGRGEATRRDRFPTRTAYVFRRFAHTTAQGAAAAAAGPAAGLNRAAGCSSITILYFYLHSLSLTPWPFPLRFSLLSVSFSRHKL